MNVDFAQGLGSNPGTWVFRFYFFDLFFNRFPSFPKGPGCLHCRPTARAFHLHSTPQSSPPVVAASHSGCSCLPAARVCRPTYSQSTIAAPSSTSSQSTIAGCSCLADCGVFRPPRNESIAGMFRILQLKCGRKSNWDEVICI